MPLHVFRERSWENESCVGRLLHSCGEVACARWAQCLERSHPREVNTIHTFGAGGFTLLSHFIGHCSVARSRRCGGRCGTQAVGFVERFSALRQKHGGFGDTVWALHHAPTGSATPCGGLFSECAGFVQHGRSLRFPIPLSFFLEQCPFLVPIAANNESFSVAPRPAPQPIFKAGELRYQVARSEIPRRREVLFWDGSHFLSGETLCVGEKRFLCNAVDQNHISSRVHLYG